MMPEIPGEGIAHHSFERTVCFACLVVFAPACGQSEIEPVGREITGSFEAPLINKGFQVIDGMLVDALPVPDKDLGHLGQDMGSQTKDLDPGQDEEPAVVGNEGEIFSLSFWVQPMKLSLEPICLGAEDQERQAMGRFFAKTRYLRCSPTGWV